GGCRLGSLLERRRWRGGCSRPRDRGLGRRQRWVRATDERQTQLVGLFGIDDCPRTRLRLDREPLVACLPAAPAQPAQTFLFGRLVGRHQARPRTRSISRPSTRSPSARNPLCSNSSVSHTRIPRIVAAVSSAKSRSTYRSFTWIVAATGTCFRRSWSAS